MNRPGIGSEWEPVHSNDKGDDEMFRNRKGVNRFHIVIGAAYVIWLCVCLTGVPVPTADAATLKEIQSLYDKKEYQKAVDEFAGLDKEAAARPDARRLKIRALLRIGKPKESLEEYDRLEASLKHEDLRVLREVALGFIIVMMKDMREQMRGAAYTALKEIESDEIVPLLEDGLSDGSAPVRVLAVEGLGHSQAGMKSKKLRVALEDQAGLVKARVVKVLGKSGDPSVIPLVEKASRDDLATVRIAAYGALIRLGRTEAWEQLRKGLAAPNPEERAEAIRTVADLQDQRGAAPMMEMLTYKQPSVRAAAARGLGHLKRGEAREQIELMLKDPIPGVRESAAAALSNLGGEESLSVLKEALGDRAFTVRAAVSAAILQLDQPYDTVAVTIRGLAQQNDTGARSSAAYALGKATKANLAGAVEMLSTLALDPLPGPKIVAIRSLGRIGGTELKPLLKESLHDQNEAVRATAGGALLRIIGIE